MHADIPRGQLQQPQQPLLPTGGGGAPLAPLPLHGPDAAQAVADEVRALAVEAARARHAPLALRWTGGLEAGAELSQLTAPDVLMLMALKRSGAHSDEAVAAALCAAVQGTSRASLRAAVQRLGELSDEAVGWLLGAALTWLGTVAVDMPSLAPAGRHLLAAALRAEEGVCRCGLRMLLGRLEREACATGPLWDALQEAVESAAAELSAERARQLRASGRAPWPLGPPASPAKAATARPARPTTSPRWPTSWRRRRSGCQTCSARSG